MHVIPRFNFSDINHTALHKAMVDNNDDIPWSAHHAALQDKVTKPTAVVELLHLFKDNAHSVAMMKHGMDILKKATQHLNPGQVPVVTVDCALYPILKKIQWIWPKTYGADNFVVMMRGLHIEMAFLAAILVTGSREVDGLPSWPKQE